MLKIMEVKKVEIKKTFGLKKSPCKKCPYKLGIIKTTVNPCPQCQLNNYGTFDEFKKQMEK